MNHHEPRCAASNDIDILNKTKRDRTTARLRRDAEQHARSVKETLEAEYADRMAAALEQSEEAVALSSTAQKKAARLGEEPFVLCV